MKETLVIVDRQKDFNDSLGSLYVLGAEDTELNTLEYIERNSDRIKEVIFTVDWHLPSDKSFERNGGIWPDHCLQFSEGAGISDVLYKACIEHNIPIQIFRKGEVSTHEEYGAFEIMSRYGDNLVLFNNCIMDSCVQVTTNNVVSHLDMTEIQEKVKKSGLVCVCNCDYCTCNCNYCICNCDYSCTCNCAYCTCDCNFCTCNCNWCPCNGHY